MRIYQTDNKKVHYLERYKENKFKSQTMEKNSDKVVISKKALNIKDVEKELAKIPELREEKVQALKNQIQNGTYQVSARSIAAKIMNNGLE